jgi:hypothetical protein
MHIDPIYVGFGVNFLLALIREWQQRRRRE